MICDGCESFIIKTLFHCTDCYDFEYAWIAMMEKFFQKGNRETKIEIDTEMFFLLIIIQKIISDDY